MTPGAPKPTPRLLRAADAERTELERHRRRLLASRETLRAELARVEDALGDISERARLLERLAPRPAHEDETASTLRHVEDPVPARALRGPAVRETAVRVLLDHPDRPEALHYRRWYELLVERGESVAGKDPVAVFLTQLNRSPVVRKSTQPGVYELDRNAPTRLRARLDDLHGQLRDLAQAPDGATDLAAVRENRARLSREIGQVEKALDEAQRLLQGEVLLPHAATA